MLNREEIKGIKERLADAIKEREADLSVHIHYAVMSLKDIPALLSHVSELEERLRKTKDAWCCCYCPAMADALELSPAERE